MSAIHKAKVFLGFADDDYDDYDRPARQQPADDYRDDYVDYAEDDYQEHAEVTPIHPAPIHPVDTSPAPRSLPRIQPLHPRNYNDAREIGTYFRDGVPVIMDLSAMDEANSKRIVDFSAGLIFGLRGSIEKIANNVFLLSPEHVEVGGETETQPDSKASFFNQS